MTESADLLMTTAAPITPSRVIREITGPIKFLANNETTPETATAFWTAAEIMYGSSLSVNNPLNENNVAEFVKAGIAKTDEFIQTHGSYANTEEGNYAQGWLMQLNSALDVVEGRRQDPRPLHYVIDHVSALREQQQTENIKESTKQGLFISSEGRINHMQVTNPDRERNDAEDLLTRMKRQHTAVKEWITGKYGAPKDSW